MSAWSHPVCAACFARLCPGREPIVLRVTDPSDGSLMRRRWSCCFCGRETDAGICYRRDPRQSPCAGRGAPHRDADDVPPGDAA